MSVQTHRFDRYPVALLTACAIVGMGEPVAADTDAARQATREIEQLAARGEFTASETLLSQVNCADDSACHTVIEFGYGWLYETWSAADEARAAELLLRARDYYRRAAELSPDNTQILANLALVSRRVGDTEAAVAATEKAIEFEPGRAFQHYLFLGDVHSSANDNDAAVAAYRAAIERNPANSLAHQRLLETYRKAGSHNALFEHSHEIRNTLPGLAATGYAYAVRQGFATDEALAERALVNWAASRANLGALAPASLGSLPGATDWDSTALRELAAVVTGDGPPPQAAEMPWWQETPERRDAMARLLRLKAATLRNAAEQAGADGGRRQERMQLAVDYLKAAVETAPPFDAYLHSELAESSNARLDAAADLVALHYALKDRSDLQSLSELSAQDLAQMTDILFSGKAGAYASGQLGAIQRYHTVLGMIFYATGRFTSNRADNATFQLEHAIDVAARIARQDASKYRPLPELQTLLAEVYLAEARKEDSARVSADAAMGYLETDNLAAAETALQKARAGGADPARTAALTTMLRGRLAIESRGIEVVETHSDSPTVVLSPELAWLAEPGALGLPQPFTDAQRFKSLADIGALLYQAGKRDVARYLNAQALDAYVEQKTLLSPTDLRRLQIIDNTISRRAPRVMSTGGENVSQSSDAPSRYQQSWSLPSAEGQAAITMNPEVLQDSRRILQQEQLQENVRFERKQE